MKNNDPALLDYGTATQAKYLQAYWDAGSYQKAADKMGVHKRVIQNAVKAIETKAARAGYAPELGLAHRMPEGYFNAKTTIQQNTRTGEIERTWTRMTADQARQNELLKAAFEALATELPQVKPRTKMPQDIDKHLLAGYPIGDAHVGMLSWAEETGEQWNLELAEQIHCQAVQRLVDLAPPSEKALIVNLGDFLHADNAAGVTSRSGHSLDMDSRYGHMASIAVKTLKQCVESALDKHKEVHLMNVIGNHDDTGAMWLAICFKHMYAHEPRVIVDASPSVFNYYRHGKVLIGCHHGHSCKADKLPGVMATDKPKDWGETEYRYWWTGHIHHQSMKDYAGVSVESFRILAAKDAYAHAGGYRAPRDMKCIVLDDRFGEQERYTVNVGMLEHALTA